MQLGMIGLGRMGSNMVQRLMRGGHQCVVFDLHADAVRSLEHDGARGSESLAHLAAQPTTPRIVWPMVPA
ncbi:MAG: 6-phosphogluconate dehydrogenase (decarboxylating), partial [Myxococcales bacterium]|nr:6-phosphogluconate dehydrogenase (decarboxylating) [Myxococcales bacterium]